MPVSEDCRCLLGRTSGRISRAPFLSVDLYRFPEQCAVFSLHSCSRIYISAAGFRTWPFSNQLSRSSSRAEIAFANHGLDYFAAGLLPCLEHCPGSCLDCISFLDKDVPSSENILALTAARYGMYLSHPASDFH